MRDGDDVPFTQYVIDTWASFVRTGDPTPELGFLAARGFVNTTRVLTGMGQTPWVPVSGGVGGQTFRQMQWPSFQRGFVEAEQCEVLGVPLDYFVT